MKIFVFQHSFTCYHTLVWYCLSHFPLRLPIFLEKVVSIIDGHNYKTKLVLFFKKNKTQTPVIYWKVSQPEESNLVEDFYFSEGEIL